MLGEAAAFLAEKFCIDGKVPAAGEEQQQGDAKEKDVGMEGPGAVMDSRNHKEADQQAGSQETAEAREHSENDECPEAHLGEWQDIQEHFGKPWRHVVGDALDVVRHEIGEAEDGELLVAGNAEERA
jgi:hypothetical protein